MRRLERRVRVGACCALIAALLAVNGCGTAEGVRPDADGGAAEGGVSTSVGEVASAGTGTIAVPSSQADPAAPTDAGDWEPPSSDIKAAFEQVRAGLGDRPVYAPTLLPPGMHLVTEVESEGGARASVTVEAARGRMVFLQVIEGDVGDLPSEVIELADGRRASMYRVLGGFLLQWAHEDAWYGLQGTGYSAEELRRVAEGMGAF